MRPVAVLWGLLVTVGLCCSVQAAHKWGLRDGAPDLQSAGQLAFGPDGILFVGDSKGAAIFAIDTGDSKAGTSPSSRSIENLDKALSELFNGAKVTLNDLAVNPVSGNIYLSVTEGGTPALVRIDAAGKLGQVSLEKVPFVKATIPNAPEDKVTGEGPRARNRRNETITDLAYAEGKVLIAGMTNGESPSAVREIAFPFADFDQGTSIEIYHGAHGKLEDAAVIRTFVPLNINGEASLLAGFTCTPLVRFSVGSLESGKKVRGTTVAELGNRNVPLDMIAYEKGGERFVLVANNNRGVMKVSTQDIGRKDGITEPVRGGGTAGQKFEPVKELEGTVQLDRVGDSHAVVVIQKDGHMNLSTVDLP